MIIVNGRFLLHRVTGVERYAREILNEIDRIIKPNEVELVLPPETKVIPNYKNIKVHKIGMFHNRLWEHLSFPFYVKKRKGISLSLCNVAPLLMPGVVCIHDVKIKVRPQDFSRPFLWWYRMLFFNACKRAKKIITVSNFSQREICKYYRIDANNVIVIPNAWQHFLTVDYDERTLDKYRLEKKQFYFSMCSMEPNKNIKWIMEAARLNRNTIFAVAGAINNTVFADGINFDCPENMRFLGYVSDEEAKTLMRDCKAFIFPTFYEGFGIPPLEALSAGCEKIMVSDTEVMHEVLGDSAVFIDPNKASVFKNEEINCDVKKVLSNYSWEKSAKSLMDLLRSLDNELN